MRAEEYIDNGEVSLCRTLHAVKDVFTRNRSKNVQGIIVNDKIANLSQLNDMERTSYVLFFVLGVTQKKIAELLGVTTVTIGQSLDSARTKMGLKELACAS